MKPQVAEAFAALPPGLRPKLSALRRLILDIAATTKGVGDIDETLKWGQPSYLTHETKSGTTIRIGAIKGSDRCYALFVNCQTDLIETCRTIYPDTFRYDGKRAIVFDRADTVDEAALGHCIALALTYHARKRRRQR